MCFGSRKSDSGEARSRELDRMLRQDERRMSKEVKLLLLGRSATSATEASRSLLVLVQLLLRSAAASAASHTAQPCEVGVGLS